MCSKFTWLVQKLWKINEKYEIIIWISGSISIYYTSLAFSISIHSHCLLGGAFPWALRVRRELAHPLTNTNAYLVLLPLFSTFSGHCSPHSAQVRNKSAQTTCQTMSPRSLHCLLASRPPHLSAREASLLPFPQNWRPSQCLSPPQEIALQSNSTAMSVICSLIGVSSGDFVTRLLVY